MLARQIEPRSESQPRPERMAAHVPGIGNHSVVNLTIKAARPPTYSRGPASGGCALRLPRPGTLEELTFEERGRGAFALLYPVTAPAAWPKLDNSLAGIHLFLTIVVLRFRFPFGREGGPRHDRGEQRGADWRSSVFRPNGLQDEPSTIAILPGLDPAAICTLMIIAVVSWF